MYSVRVISDDDDVIDDGLWSFHKSVLCVVSIVTATLK